MLDIKSVTVHENKLRVEGKSYDWDRSDFIGYFGHYESDGVTQVEVVRCNSYPGGNYLFRVDLTLSEEANVQQLIERIPEDVNENERPAEDPKDFRNMSAFVSEDDEHLPQHRRLMGV